MAPMALAWSTPTRWSTALRRRNSPTTWSPRLRRRINNDFCVTKEVSVPADVILHNAKIATNGVPSFVEAVAIEGEKILVTGTSAEVFRHRGPSTLGIDARGPTVIPGLTDSHLHVIRRQPHHDLQPRLS